MDPLDGYTFDTHETHQHTNVVPMAHPDAGQPAKGVKRRASKACQGCRARKVRCNVARSGPPCVHCKLDGVECIVSKSRRKRRKTVDETLAVVNEQPILHSGDAAAMVGAAYGHLQNQDVFHFQGESRVGESSQDTSSRSANPDMSVLNGSVGPFSPTGSFRRPGQGNTDFSQDMQQSNGASPHKIEHSQSLPAYIKALPSRFERDDITYLRNKGVLTIPDDELRNELLRNYAEYIHPFMPSIDLHTFVRSINQNDGEQPDSLLLFQAVMFSRTAIVNMDLLRAAGYNNRQEARRVFFEKVRPLYDIDYEDDSIILIQLLGQL